MRVVTFGEVMIRLAPPEFLRVRQTIPGPLESTFGGGELNVAVSIAMQGGESAFLTALPDNVLTDALVQELRKLNVDASLIQRSQEGRFGIYFVETGANQRGGTVTYDRSGTSVALQPPDFYDWERAFAEAGWFHITGITPAISREAADAALHSVQAAKNAGLTVSCDLNFRSKLWNWEPGTSRTWTGAPRRIHPGSRLDLARRTMRGLLPFIDLVVANEEDAEKSLGIKAAASDVEAGKLDLDGYRQVAGRIVSEFPNVRKVAITLRESYSASHNNWGAMLFDAATEIAHFAPVDADTGQYRPYEMRNIVDRVGAGDSFAGALIFALTTPELADPAVALQYAVAASCLKHSIKGDFNYVTRDEIEELMHGTGSGRHKR